jgi:hypothetical protein
MSPEATNPPQAPLRTPSKPATDGQGITLRTSFFVLDWTVNFTRTTVVNVAENRITHVSYRAPRSVLVAFRPGKLTAEPQPQR